MIESRKYGVVHGIATCKDCGKEFQNHKNAQALASKHASDYGHTVNGEVGYAYTYVGFKKPLASRQKRGAK